MKAGYCFYGLIDIDSVNKYTFEILYAVNFLEKHRNIIVYQQLSHCRVMCFMVQFNYILLFNNLIINTYIPQQIELRRFNGSIIII